MHKFEINNRPYNSSRKVYAFQSGGAAEKRFRRAAETTGYVVTKTSRKVDILKHVDFWLESGGKKWGVDVKGNNLPDEIWCEFQNVQGKPGWMYGVAKAIAFDMPEEGGFSVVSTAQLREWCEEHVSKEIVYDKKLAYRRRYNRRGNQDLITKLFLSDLKLLPSYRVWEYFTDY